MVGQFDTENTMLLKIKIIAFIITSIGIVLLSRFSLRNLSSHGFYRFFAWEALVALVLLNIEYWFKEPFNLYQMISWPLLVISTYFVFHGIHSLQAFGKQDSTRDDPTLLEIEKTCELVTKGAYRFVRHPLYSSLLFLVWGAFFKNPALAGIILTGTATLFLVVTAKVEEAENIHFFGAAYEDYMKRTKMFIPFFF